MNKKLIFPVYIALLAALLGDLCSAMAQEVCDDSFVALKQRILTKLDEIDNYQFDTTVSSDHNVAHSQIIGNPPNRLRVSQEIKKGSEELINTIVFDGNHQWVESKFSNNIIQVSKIKLSGVVDADRPFDTGYYLQGTGLFGGEDYPSTVKVLLSIYNLSAICSHGKLILAGYLNEKAFDEYAGKRKFAKFNKTNGFRDRYKKNFKYARIVFGIADSLLYEYALGPSNKSESLKVIVQNIVIDKYNLKDVFIFQSPRGIEVNDITDELKKALSVNQ